jgi:hypothetical protein
MEGIAPSASTDPPGPELNINLSTLSTLIASLALAAIIAGEAPGCPIEAKLAVAHVAQRNTVWYARGKPTPEDIYVALHWREYQDPTHGAQFLIGPGDAAKMRGLGKRTARFQCAGTWLEAWSGNK